MRGRRVVAGLGGAAAIAACFPAYGIGGADGGSGNDGGADSPPGDGTLGGDGESAGDGRSDSGDAAGQGDGPTSPPSGSALALANAGNVPTASGTAQQQHVVVVGGNYWLFYFAGVDDQVHTRWSSDFVHWTDGASLTLPMTNAGEGRNLAVATRTIGGVDVVHVATSLLDGDARIVWDTRATVTGTIITFGTPVKVHDLDYADTWTDAATQYPPGSLGGAYCDPDGTGVTITDDGVVHIATAWVAIPGCCSCDSNFTQSNAPDLGTSWEADAGFLSPLQHYTVTNATHGRQVVPLHGGSLLAGWDQADDSLPSDIVWATDRSGLWSDEDVGSQLLVFSSDSDHERQNDWSFCRIDDTHVHAVRRAYDSSGGASRVFEHVVFDGTKWSSGAPLASDEGLDGSGVVLLTNGTEVLAAAIGDDTNASIRYATWDGSVLERVEDGARRRARRRQRVPQLPLRNRLRRPWLPGPDVDRGLRRAVLDHGHGGRRALPLSLSPREAFLLALRSSSPRAARRSRCPARPCGTSALRRRRDRRRCTRCRSRSRSPSSSVRRCPRAR